ncbi:thioredoxin family protein [Arcanobacterium pinnipediorum]|uniref:Thioredoxin family protein n=1 Tax=Arcanobacterium pinnipediorum TaxID=1503041 RepID=A0ABY5AIZ6_9ACTO|nr:thioredoxin family protein [Arcanobacterium pinnipediorum]USR79411.1 thioredoxin family protein [Arcanobacterium pinnipediorum]
MRYFFASWSLASIQMRRIFNEVAADICRYIQNVPELSGTPLTVLAVDIDQQPTLVETHGITHVPAIQLSANSQDLITLVGARPKLALRSELITALEKHSINARVTKE